MRRYLAFVVLATGCALGAGEAPIGESQQALFNGEVSDGDPAVALLYMFADVDGDRLPALACSGSLIVDPRALGPSERRHVLTARHCLVADETTPYVEPGHRFTASFVDVYFGTEPQVGDDPVTVEAVALHPTADLALLTLTETAPHRPLRLNVRDISDRIGAIVRPVGFGAMDSGGGGLGTKRTGEYKLLAVADRDVGAAAVTGDPESDQSSMLCGGDSGGPTLLAVGGVEHVMGVHAQLWALATDTETDPPLCEENSTYGILVRVDRYTDWLAREMGVELLKPPVAPYLHDGDADGTVDDGGCSIGSLSAPLWVIGMLLLARRRPS